MMKRITKTIILSALLSVTGLTVLGAISLKSPSDAPTLAQTKQKEKTVFDDNKQKKTEPTTESKAETEAESVEIMREAEVVENEQPESEQQAQQAQDIQQAQATQAEIRNDEYVKAMQAEYERIQREADQLQAEYDRQMAEMEAFKNREITSDVLVDFLREASKVSDNENVKRLANVTSWSLANVGDKKFLAKSATSKDAMGFSVVEGFIVPDDNILLDHVCSTCNGTGVEQTYEDYTCGICGGTGQQYIPNAYFNMGWHGQWQMCSGCSGMGYYRYYNNIECRACGGYRFI